MGEEVLSLYLRRKLSSILGEAESDSVIPSHVISRFRSIETRIKSNPPMMIRVDLLYQLIESVSECLVFSYKRRTAAVSKKGFGICFYYPKLLLHPLSEFILNRRMGSRLDSIERELIRTRPPNPPPPPPPPPRLDIAETRTPIAADPSLIIGFEAEADKIEALLMPSQEEEEEAAWRAVGIVGRFGCGKTALAQKVFTSARIVNEFWPRIWVSLSNMLQSDEDPTVGVVNHILNEIGGHDDRGGVSDSDHMSCLDKLAEELQGKRYLIVLDDAWRLPDEWCKGLLSCGFPSGGAVIVTSRREDVIRRVVEDVDHKRAKNVIRLHLSDEICWQIFTQVVQQRGKLEITEPNLCSIKIYWIPARGLSITWGDDTRYWRWSSLSPPQQMEEEVAELMKVSWLEIIGTVELKKLLVNTNYSAYLVFKLKEKRDWLHLALTARVRITCDGKSPEALEECHVFIDPEKTPPRQRAGRLPRLRQGEGEGEREREGDEGWMEMKLGDFFTTLGDDGRCIEVALLELKDLHWKYGLVVKGIELRWNVDV
ncbi:hypothetical protein C2S51_016728 [Perilla frutescens var. frutescens]|nr:hypothetical protein C2S51_016728 [Perilla frutescens var. frutescens]